MSMEEQRARQEDEARKAVAASVSEVSGGVQKMEGMCQLLLYIIYMYTPYQFIHVTMQTHTRKQ